MPPRNLSLLLLLLLATGTGTAWSQERKKVTEESGQRSSRINENYYVLKNSPDLKDGPYQKLHNNNMILSGYYDHGHKDSIWEAYNSRHVLLSRKWYTQDKMVGKWELFNWKGEPEFAYDFTTGKLTYAKDRKADTTTYFYQTAAGDWVRASMDQNPIPLYGSGDWLSFLNRSFRYPDDAVNNELQGTVVISMMIDENGRTSDYAVFRTAAPVLDQEALRVVSLFDYQFIPAQKDGKKVKTIFLQPLIFKLEKG